MYPFLLEDVRESQRNYVFLDEFADSLPMISLALSSFTTAAIAVTSIFAGFLTVSTASLQCQGIFTRQSPFLVSEPTRNLFVSY